MKKVFYLSAANKVSDSEMITDAENRMEEFLQPIQKSFYYARQAENFEQMLLKLQQGADINKKFGKLSFWKYDNYMDECPGDNALTFAVRTGNLRMATFLLENGANPDVEFAGESPLSNVCWNHNPAMVELLLDHHAEIVMEINSALNYFTRDPLLATLFGLNRSSQCHNAPEATRILELLLSRGYSVTPESQAVILSWLPSVAVREMFNNIIANYNKAQITLTLPSNSTSQTGSPRFFERSSVGVPLSPSAVLSSDVVSERHSLLNP